MAREAHLIQVIDRIGADPDKTTGQFFWDMADYLEIEGGDLAPAAALHDASAGAAVAREGARPLRRFQ